MELSRVGIVIVHGRDENKWFKDCIDSCKNQAYPNFVIHVEENLDRKRSIGKCWNDAVTKLQDCEYVYFVGDDDFISPDIIYSSAISLSILRELRDKKHVQCSTYLTMVDERGDMLGYTMRIPTGLWLRQWLVEHPFDETLKNLVDAKHLDKITELGYMRTILAHHFGYYYRQHSSQVTGRKMPDIDTRVEWTRKIYSDECMSHFSNGFINNHGFVQVPIGRLASYDNMMVFGIYEERTLNVIGESVRPLNLVWCGSDLIKYANEWKNKYDLSKKDNITHIAQCEEQKELLEKLGIKALLRPLYAGDLNDWTVKPLPDKPAVLYYANTEKWNLYGIQHLVEVAKSLPDVEFHLIGDKGQIVNMLPNMVNHGWVDVNTLKKIMDRVSIYLRLTEWDGFAHLVSEATMSGRYVVCNHNLPYVRRAKNVPEAVAEIKKLLKTTKPNRDGARAYRELLNNFDFLEKKTCILL